jgi:hypothetical protein
VRAYCSTFRVILGLGLHSRSTPSAAESFRLPKIQRHLSLASLLRLRVGYRLVLGSVTPRARFNTSLAMPPNILPEDSQLISNLVALAEKSPKLVKSSQYSAPSVPEATVWSWKMNEHKYYDVPSPFPTLARGLFTTVVEPGKFRIVARGYDKFFNIGEVPWTTVSRFWVAHRHQTHSHQRIDSVACP